MSLLAPPWFRRGRERERMLVYGGATSPGPATPFKMCSTSIVGLWWQGQLAVAARVVVKRKEVSNHSISRNGSKPACSALRRAPRTRWMTESSSWLAAAATALMICALFLYGDTPTATAVGTSHIHQEEEDKTAEPPDTETLSNIPQMLSGECVSGPQDCNKSRIQRPKSRKAETCTIKCVTTCIRGGLGEGPLNVRRPLVVFKQGFRSRKYCLAECSDICNLIEDGDSGP